MAVFKFILNNFFEAVYCIGYRRTEKTIWDERISSFHVLKPSWKYWYADPVPARINGQNYVFVEQYNRYTGVGHIGISKWKENGKLSRPQIIIQEKTHMSFPMIVPYKGGYYMIPESSQTETIEIYCMGDSPYCWKHYYSIPINEKIVDLCYMVQEDDSILLLGGVPKQENEHYTARKLIHLKNLDKKELLTWEQVSCDNEYTLYFRAAGNFFERNQKNYRPTQESTENIYGLYVDLFEQNKIGLSGIKEERVDRKSVKDIKVSLNPLLYKKVGIHTYGINKDGLEVIDISCVHPSLFPLIHKIVHMSSRKEEK